MIVSYHPIIEADRNLLCAGREPDVYDLAVIRSADAVILPQGCSQALYRLARANCPQIFPNMDTRFDYPGKLGQIRLFRRLKVAHPKTCLFSGLDDYYRLNPEIAFPVVLKLDWGGQGETVFKAVDQQALATILERVAACEKSGQSGFLIQSFVPTQNRSLRVAVIGNHKEIYWRIQTVPHKFGTAVSQGACIDHFAEPELQKAALEITDAFRARTGLQLAGFDFIFDCREAEKGCALPLMLEINYFFGRKGLGGSQRFYRILEKEIDLWLAGTGLRR